MAFPLKVKSLLLAGLSSILFSAAMQEAAQAEPVMTSYYGGELAGNPTASGEPFDPYALTAAHPSLPFGTLLTVSNNGRSVTVKVNDRGPYVAGRGLDLSLGAAQEIGLTDAGAAVIDVEAAGTPQAKPPVLASEPTKPAPTTEQPAPAEPTSTEQPAPTEPAAPTRAASTAGTTSPAKARVTGEHHMFISEEMLVPPGERVFDSVGEGSTLQPHEVDTPDGQLFLKGPIKTRLPEVAAEPLAQALYLRPSARGRRRGEPDIDSL